MKTLKKVPEKIVERTVIDKEFCDICKRDFIDIDSEDSVVNINAKIGNAYPEGDFRTGYIIDVCANCFMEKIKPLIETQFNLEFREVDFAMDEPKFENFYK